MSEDAERGDENYNKLSKQRVSIIKIILANREAKWQNTRRHL